MLKDDILNVYSLQQHLCLHTVVTTDVKQQNTISIVTWRIAHEHMHFTLRRAHQCHLFMNSKHHKSDAFQVTTQLLVVTTREIYMRTQEYIIVIHRRPIFYCCYVDGICNRRKKFNHDKLFEKLNTKFTTQRLSKLLKLVQQKVFGYKFTS